MIKASGFRQVSDTGLRMPITHTLPQLLAMLQYLCQYFNAA